MPKIQEQLANKKRNLLFFSKFLLLFCIHIDIITIGKERLIFLPKIKIKYELISNGDITKKEILGLKRDKTIIYKENNLTTSINILNDNIIMKRDDNETSLTINLGKENNATYFVKSFQKSFLIDINLYKKEITNNMIYFKYKSNDQITEYKLEYEVIS